jgi:hypothetical protein
VDVHVTNATKIGDKTCLIQLENTTDKTEIMKNKRKLRNLKDWSRKNRENNKNIVVGR